jgi:hypothetical protein
VEIHSRQAHHGAGEHAGAARYRDVQPLITRRGARRQRAGPPPRSLVTELLYGNQQAR